MARPVTSRRRAKSEEGFALIEMLAVLAIMGLLAAILLPKIPTGTSRTKLESLATEMAALLKADRAAALYRRVRVITLVDTSSRSLRSGATGRIVTLPSDVRLDAMLAARCADRRAGQAIEFFPSGTSCGGVLALVRAGIGYEVRVNWLTGGVDVVRQKQS